MDWLAAVVAAVVNALGLEHNPHHATGGRGCVLASAVAIIGGCVTLVALALILHP